MKNSFKIFFTTLIFLMVAACSLQPTPEPVVTEAPTKVFEVATPTLPPEIPVAPLSNVVMDERLLATINTGEYTFPIPPITRMK